MKNKIKLLGQIFVSFFKLGCFSFGGGYAMIPLIEREVVEQKKWLEKEKIVDVFAVAGALPGAIGLNASAFVGYSIAGIPGAVVGLIGNLLPSVLITLTLVSLLLKFNSNVYVQAALRGIRPAVVGLIGYAAVKLGKTSLQEKAAPFIALCALAIALFLPGIPLPLIIVLGAVAGLVILQIRKGRKT